MVSLTTGLIENTGVSGVRPCTTLLATISNTSLVSATVRISGYYWTGMDKKEYVLDLLTVAPGEIANNNFYANFDVFEFQFISISDYVEISVRGKSDAGGLTAVYNMLPAQLFPIGMEGIAKEESKMTIPTALNRVYVLNSSHNNVSVIDGISNTFMGNVIIGSGPFGVGVNPITNRIYVANFGSNNVSVIDGNSNMVITTVTVGSNPVGLGVNPATNRIYVTNWGSNSVSVIDGLTHVVISTIMVDASPEGVNVNPATNLIYITNHGSNNVSVIDGSNNVVKTIINLGI
ncbi:YncE family protein [Desulfosporosinus lacus]|uniref:40-residue YVTN family beta-propeller repeat-containing protein n=1 Tax=Desulfosporosinus lacus DSM 15449 TaxID=1121420 RepID=A0A1M6FXI4_9FIRM|nr:YncE family protein [Desulfosporosinus lacus]SHJ02396.1 40-residue YVTN family beta-propeller repeat-containing protein [Desulfosporosinus lacus DSM 15449]